MTLRMQPCMRVALLELSSAYVAFETLGALTNCNVCKCNMLQVCCTGGAATDVQGAASGGGGIQCLHHVPRGVCAGDAAPNFTAEFEY